MLDVFGLRVGKGLIWQKISAMWESNFHGENRNNGTPNSNYTKALGFQLTEKATKKILKTSLSMFRFVEA